MEKGRERSLSFSTKWRIKMPNIVEQPKEPKFPKIGELINPKGTVYVQVKARIKHKCEINKVLYDLKKDEKYLVSEFAETVLAQANIV